MTTKRSYGILCFYKDKLLMLECKYTYQYYSILFGTYQEPIKTVIEGLTYEEKQKLLNKPYDDLKDLHIKIQPMAQKNIYNFRILYKTQLQHSIIHDSKHGALPWTFPKGRKDLNESAFKAACREFEEETGISSSKIKQLPIKPYVIKYQDGKHNYIHVLYFATLLADTKYKTDNIHSRVIWVTKDVDPAKTDYITQNYILKELPQIYDIYDKNKDLNGEN